MHGIRHVVGGELRSRGHDPVAVDLPCEEELAGWEEYADAVVEASAAAAAWWSLVIRSVGSQPRLCAFAFPSTCPLSALRMVDLITGPSSRTGPMIRQWATALTRVLWPFRAHA